MTNVLSILIVSVSAHHFPFIQREEYILYPLQLLLSYPLDTHTHSSEDHKSRQGPLSGDPLQVRNTPRGVRHGPQYAPIMIGGAAGGSTAPFSRHALYRDAQVPGTRPLKGGVPQKNPSLLNPKDGRAGGTWLGMDTHCQMAGQSGSGEMP